ncbi:hypothetical protein GH714_018435 [Hevea brasiliensis]|uniref:Protein kinase domain-containing protein n=1 Tax=Hevea brasiliensis TaxID=3981 RepID=A0A6A6LLL8_HEVBR|nr:hypothetical protein GH714_018435 [Hevea brasiliensis]
MQSLKKVWLANNEFSGEIPPSLMHISNLIELHLEDNQFSGTIPSITLESKLTSFNVSNNKLRGKIPEGLPKFSKSSFEGNDDLCGENIGKECKAAIEALAPGAFASTIAMDTSGNHTPNIKKTGAGILTLALMLLSVAVVVIMKMRRKEDDFEAGGRDNTNNQEAVETVEVQVSTPVTQNEMELTNKPGSSRKGSNTAKGGVGELVIMNNEKGVFGLIDLMEAAAEVLGNGGLGCSYKTLMANGVAVVVKRLREMNALGKDGFYAEIRKLGSLRHPNILPPLAFHYRKDEKLLIYEYIPKGSLLYLLHGDKRPSHAELNWPDRLKIVEGIARGLDYLHTELATCDLPHGNLKSSNVLLSPDNEPLLSEFGFSPLINPSIVGQALIAHKAPEAAQFGVSPKCDDTV